MALTGFCKKCKREVPSGELCPYCGSRLGTNAARTAWCVERSPVKDWMSWNAVMRILLPGTAGIILLIALAEWLSGGTGALESLLAGLFLPVTLLVLAMLALLTLVCLLLQGDELTDVVIDGKGIHVTTYLNNPTPLRLLTRLKPVSLLRETVQNGNGTILVVNKRELAWRDVARVQLWPEKCMILFYAPAGWMRISVVCNPFNWQDALTMIREKIGKKKNVQLPQMLRVTAEKKTPARRTCPGAVTVPAVEEAIQQITMEDMMSEEPQEQLPLPEDPGIPEIIPEGGENPHETV